MPDPTSRSLLRPDVSDLPFSERPRALDTTRVAEFSRRVYEEHLEEAALLFAQRYALLGDVQPLAWRSLARFERRLDAHVDALVVGGDVALRACLDRIPNAEDGERYATVALALRLQQWDAARDVIAQIDCGVVGSARSTEALVDILTAELPDRQAALTLERLTGHSATLLPLALRVSGRRRIDLGSRTLAALASPDVTTALAAIEAVSSLRDSRAVTMLHRLVSGAADPIVKSAAALALARLGDERAITLCVGAARSEAWPMLSLGLMGGRSTVSLLLRAVAEGRLTGETIIALGLVGDIRAVGPLLDLLGDEVFAADAACALDVVTGAGLMNEVLVPDEVHPDELFDEEQTQSSNVAAGVPRVPRATPAAGVNMTILSRSPDVWHTWWATNRTRFAPHVRYRRGKAYSPRTLLDMLSADLTPRPLRQLAHDELAIRYGCPVPFSTSTFVDTQERALREVDAWICRQERGDREGAWYFAGRALTA